MKARTAFDSLKKVGKKEYFSRNGEEEIFFYCNEYIVRVYSSCSKIDIAFGKNGQCQNYLNSPELTYNQKRQIQSALNAQTSIKVKGKTISNVLLETINNTTPVN